MEQDLARDVCVALREMSATAKALRLYPPSSPIPLETAASAAGALDGVFAFLPVLSLAITKEGFSLAGEPIEHAATSVDLARMLQTHGVAEVSFMPGCDSTQIAAFLGIVLREPSDVVEQGGVGLMLAAADVASISVSDVRLTVLDSPHLGDVEDVDDFLRSLAGDATALTNWLASATSGDLVTLQESLAELARSAGREGVAGLTDALAQAFLSQAADGRDALLGLALDHGPAKELAGGLLGLISSSDLAQSLCQGLYGRNMLSLSTAMTALPIADRFGAVMSQVRELLPQFGHGAKELEFLDHMVEARRSPVPEIALAEKDRRYGEIASNLFVDAADIEDARAELAGSEEFARKRTVGTLLSLLDQQKDFRLYCQTLDALTGLVPRLLEAGDLALATRALGGLAERESRADHPWPEVAERLRQARDKATSGPAMAHILTSVAADEDLASEAHDLMVVAGDAAPRALVVQALGARDCDGLAVAEVVLGRRIDDLLPAMAGEVQWFQVAALAKRLADQGDPRSRQALETLANRPDPQVRREAAKGLGASGNPAVLNPLRALLRDSSGEVVSAAAMALAASGASGTASIVGDRLGELDLDGADFAVARQLIAALARMRDPWARDVLSRLAGRRALIKKGHFTEVQGLARNALKARKDGGL